MTLHAYFASQEQKYPVGVIGNNSGPIKISNLITGEVVSRTDTEYRIFWTYQSIEETLNISGGIAMSLDIL